MLKLARGLVFTLLVLLLWAVPAAAAIPTAPDDLEAEAYSSTRIDLSWDDRSSDETRFYIYRKTGSDGTYTQIASVTSNTKEYRDTSVRSGIKYYYKVQAYNSSGSSDFCDEVYATAGGSSSSSLKAPDDLEAEAYSSTRINLTWDDNSSDETRFYIYRKKGSSGTYSQIDYVTANTKEYRDTNLDEDTRYYYKVRAYDGSVYSEYSNEDYATTRDDDDDDSDLDAPDSLVAEAYSSSRINLTWDDNSSDETRFYIYRKKGSSSTYSQIASVSANTEEYRDTGLNEDTKYYYKVRAYDGDDYSDFSNEDYATTDDYDDDDDDDDEDDLDAPDDLEAKTYSDSRIDLTWNDNSRGESRFYIYRRTGSSGTYDQIASVSSDIEKYSDTSLEDDTRYYYRIRAVDGSSYSEYSNEDYATTGEYDDDDDDDEDDNDSDLDAPDNLNAKVNSSSRVTLTWEDSSKGETRFYIYRKTGSSGTYSQIASVSANTEEYRDTGLDSGTKYYYKVRAYDGDDYSKYSDEDYVITEGTYVDALGAPSNLTVTAGNGSVRLAWADNAGKEAAFVVERSAGSGSYSELIWLGPNITSYIDNTAIANNTYSYRMRAYNTDGYSEYSNVATVQSSSSLNYPSSQGNQLRFSTGKKTYYNKGQAMSMDAAPINLNDRVMIPIKYVTDQLGASVTYDAKAKKVTISYKDKIIELWAGKNKASVNSVSKPLDAASSKVTPVIVPPGRIMVPVRFVSENLGCKVEWEAATNTAVVTLP